MWLLCRSNRNSECELPVIIDNLHRASRPLGMPSDGGHNHRGMLGWAPRKKETDGLPEFRRLLIDSAIEFSNEFVV